MTLLQSALAHRTGGAAELAQRLLLRGGRAARPGRGGGGWGAHHVDPAALALLDTAKSGVYRVVGAFGPVLSGVLANAKAAPAFGSAATAGAVLAGFLEQEE